MDPSRENSLSSTFSINNILQEETRRKASQDATTVSYAHDFESAITPKLANSPAPSNGQNTSLQNCTTIEKASQSTFSNSELATKKEASEGKKYRI